MLGFYLVFVLLSMATPLTLGWAAICHFAARLQPLRAFVAAALGGFAMWGLLEVSSYSRAEHVMIFASIGAIATSLWWAILYLGDKLAVWVVKVPRADLLTPSRLGVKQTDSPTTAAPPTWN